MNIVESLSTITIQIWSLIS